MDISLSKFQELVMDKKPRMMQSMGSQRVGHDWVSELNWTEEIIPILWKYTLKYLGMMCYVNVTYLNDSEIELQR